MNPAIRYEVRFFSFWILLLSAVVSSTGLASPLDELVADSAPVHLGIMLRARDPEGLRRLLEAQQDPASPSYHAWIDPETFGDRFGHSETDYAEVVSWFEAQGFRVTKSPNRLFLEAIGRVDTVRGAFGIQQRWAQRAGKRFRTFDELVQLPTAFADRVLHISGLDTRIRQRHHLSVSLGGQPELVLGPDDLRVQYGLTSLLTAAAPSDCSSGSSALSSCYTTVVLDAQEGTTSGNGEQCGSGPAIPPFIPPSTEAIAAYFSLAHVTATYNPIVLPNAGDDFNTCGSNQESQLDVEMQGVGAPNAAQIDLVLSPASETFSTGAQYIVNQIPKAVAVSLSIGGCEAYEAGNSGPTSAGSLMQTLQQTIQQGLAEGQMWFAASGDTGADDCNDDTSGTGNGFGGHNATVDFPASLPEVVAVGGTQFSGSGSWSSGGALTSIAPETVWNEQQSLPPQAQGGAGGGGQSRYYTKPSYQVGIGPNAADGQRDVPDIALAAASATPGVAIYDCGANQDQTCADNSTTPGPQGSIDIFGGTSVSSPLAAGMFAQLAAVVGCRQGDIHPALYKLGSAQQDGGPAVFRDITSGNNSFVDFQNTTIAGFSAAAGYDLATGWGTVDASALTSNWPACGVEKSGGSSGCSTAPGETTALWLPLGLILLALRRRS